MAEPNDHDVLVKIETLVGVMIKKQDDFTERYERRHSELLMRVSVLENSDSKDSERFKSFGEQIQRSLDNANKIEKITADINNLGENLRDLKSKSNLWDMANAIGAAVAAAIGWVR